MKNKGSSFFCTECGAETGKWSGKCPACGAWNTLRETERITGRSNVTGILTVSGKVNIKPCQMSAVGMGNYRKITTGIMEFDRVIGGGIIPGMVVLIGGEPGIGKSTLMLQISSLISAGGIPALYISGEESDEQVAVRSKRLKCQTENMQLLCSGDINDILSSLDELKPGIVVIDSIQSVYNPDLNSAPGTISQLRDCTVIIMQRAKQDRIPVLLIGHVTKDGLVAGPKMIEHMVDTVMYFEGEVHNQFKILRTVKNRFGSTNEIGLFEMTSQGLQEVKDPSGIFLQRDKSGSGLAVGCVLEGTRTFLVEVQALSSPASYGTPQRVSLGLDHRRLAMLLAVLEKNLALKIRFNDVFVNLAGGIRVFETGLDLAAAAAILSSHRNKDLPVDTIFLGEVGLNGNIRPVLQQEKRLQEAKRLGFNRAVIPDMKMKKDPGLIIFKIKHIKELYSHIMKEK